MKDLLRRVGNQPARELVELPRAAGVMEKRVREEREAMQRVGGELEMRVTAYSAGAMARAWGEYIEAARGNNCIGDAGACALWDAVLLGSVPRLGRLYADNNRIGNEGLAGLARAIGEGRLEGLSFLDLSCNRIGDAGMVALAEAIEGGSCLGALQTLYLYSNLIGDRGVGALTKALLAPTRGLPTLERLWLSENQIGDGGVAAISRALEGGALPCLNSLRVEGNPAKRVVQEHVLQALEMRNPTSISGTEGPAPRELAGLPTWWIA
ncbi:MAG: hypothetical protein SGPRY_011620 [Prymnesium sp.]